MLTLKTYDPTSGATLKYSTNKAAEVSRLIQILGRLARPMCGLPELKDEVPILGAGVGGDGEGSGVGTPTVESVPGVTGSGRPGQQTQGIGGGKKKGKKGKK
jgi:Signal recognition particle 9 kDa protein (SRP9)